MVGSQYDSRHLVGRRAARVLVVDDHPLVREGLAARLANQPDFELSGEAASVSEAIHHVRGFQPDLVVVDIQLAGSHGVDLIKEVSARWPSIKMLVISAFEESLYAERCLRAGAHGYINKREVPECILEALRTIASGECYLSPAMTRQVVARAVLGGNCDKLEPVERLSNRELEVFQLIGRGMTTGAIARQLHLSVHTIDTHREKIRHKLGVKNGAELVQRAVQWVLENG